MQVETGYEVWIKSYTNKTTRAVLKLGYNAFIQFLEETTKQKWNDQKLLKERTEDIDNRSYGFEQKLVEFYNWLENFEIRYEKLKTKDRQKISDSTRKGYLKGIRSFFAFHRLDFKLTNQQKLKLSKKPRPAIRYYDFSLDDITKMNRFANPKERYILLVGRDMGLRAGDFVSLKQGLFTAHLKEKEQPYSLGKIYTQKEGVLAYPFLTNEGKRAVETWLNVLKSKGLRNDTEPMLNIKKAELSENLKRLAKKSGVETGNEKVRFHALRKFLIDRLSSTTSESKWKQIVGKEVSESAYVSELGLRQIYARAIPLIQTRQITENNHAKLGLLEETIRQMEKEIRTLKARNTIQQNDIESLKERLDTATEMIAHRMIEIIKEHPKEFLKYARTENE